jgi:transcriptional regulator with XRE-family HTH domain
MAELAKLFAENMRVRRVELTLSQEALGAPLGVDRVAVSRIEKSAPNLSISKATAIAEVLGTSVSEMVGGPKSDKTAQQIAESLGAAIRRSREEKEQNQKAFAATLNVDRNWISALETGKRNITFGTIEKFASVLGACPLEFL